MSTNNKHTVRMVETQDSDSHRRLAHVGRRFGLIVSAFVAALAVLALCVAPALADYEQASEHFGTTSEAEQLLEKRAEGEQLKSGLAIAINTTGAGGVEPGTIYVVGNNARVVRYGPGKEGEEPAFREAWGWGVGDEEQEYERCGPVLATVPTQHTSNTCIEAPASGVALFGGEQTGHFSYPSAVAVDQATGHVYVRNTILAGRRQRHLIEVFTATGVPVGEGFGEAGRENPSPAESISEGPEKIHQPSVTAGFYEGLAVDQSGVVYVTDADSVNIANPAREEARVMAFKPEHSNDFEHYVYSGRANDITILKDRLFSRIALTGSRLVASTQEAIYEYDLSGGSMPLCTYLVPGGELQSMTANPLTGEVFYYEPLEKKIHRLGACDPKTSKFTVLQAPITQAPISTEVFGLVVNPVLSWGPLRPEGVLYAVDGEQHEETAPGGPQKKLVLRGIGDVFVPARVFAPSVDAESVAGTTTDSSVLHAEINPNGFTTDYRFQYLDANIYTAQRAQAEREGKDPEEMEAAAFAGAAEVPAGGGVLPAGGIGVASVGIGGLGANTEYRFRVVASSQCEGPSLPACVTWGPAATFSTYPLIGAGLPDGRVYELVSPPEKHGGEVFPADPRVDSCAKKGQCKPPGSTVLVRFPMQSSPDGNGVVYMGYPFTSGEGAVFDEYLSRRTASGWQTSDLSPGLQATSGGSVAFDTALGEDLLEQRAPQLSANAPVGYENLYMQEVSDPGALRPLIAMSPPNRPGAAFKLQVAGTSPDMTRAFFSANDVLTGATVFAPEPADPGAFESDLYEWHEGSLVLVNVLPGNTGVGSGASYANLGVDAHGVSVDGSRVFWTAGGHLYVRVNGEETLEVANSGTLLAASADGREVLLSNGTVERFNGESGVYERAEDLSVAQGGFQGIVGTGEENNRFARIYYVDTEALVGSGENQRGQAAQTGENNLYVWEADAPRFIATLGKHDEESEQGLKDWSGASVDRTAEVSPSGDWLAFGSYASLTDYDNKAASGCAGASCSEVFLYDAVSGLLACVSCNPTGEAPRGPSTLRRIDGDVHGSQPRYLTDAGRLVFDSGDRLTAADSNGSVEDVYEYEPENVGTCTSSGGCVVLISPGTGTVDSNFLAMDETGKNIFFTTRERLVPQDKDELIDVYDAREGGGFASRTETQRTECQGEACQATPAPPLFTTPGSSTFSGAGNLLQQLAGGVVPTAKAKTTKKSSAAPQKCRRQRSKRKRLACERRARRAAVRARSGRHGKKGGAR